MRSFLSILTAVILGTLGTVGAAYAGVSVDLLASPDQLLLAAAAVGLGAVTITASDLRAALAQLSPDEKRALLATVPDQAGDGTPKWAHVIDAVPNGQIDAVMAACSKIRVEGDPKRRAQLLTEASGKWPALIAAAQTNSAYRQKPIGHSMGVIVLRLTERKAGLHKRQQLLEELEETSRETPRKPAKETASDDAAGSEAKDKE